MNVQTKRKVLGELRDFQTKLEIYKSSKEDYEREALRQELLSKYGKLEPTIEKLVGRIRFSSHPRMKNVDPFMMGLGVGHLSADDAAACLDVAFSFLSKAIGALQSEIGEGIEIVKAGDVEFYKELQDWYEELESFQQQLYGGKVPRDELEPLRDKLIRRAPRFKQRVIDLTGKQYGEQFGRPFDIWDEALSQYIYDGFNWNNRFSLNALVDCVNEALGVLESEEVPKDAAGAKMQKDSAEGEENTTTEMEHFHDELIKYRELAVTLAKGQYTKRQWQDFQKLRLELQRLYGYLGRVIEEYGGRAVVLIGDKEHDAFVFALGYETVNRRTFRGLESAIMKVNTARGGLEKISKSEKPVQEAVFVSGKLYDAYKAIMDVFTKATKILIIVDPWVDRTLFTMLENVQPKVKIQILTQNMKSDFELAGNKFKEQREKSQQGRLEIRKSNEFHDRFIVADNRVIHLGASIKDAGAKTCLIKELAGADIKATLKEIIAKYWEAAKTVL